MICVRCRVTGRVQGVWFRGSTRREALALGITGEAVNLPDGSVQVLACGEAHAVERLKAWLWQGPPAARVDNVTCEPVDMPPPADFSTA
ncbi:MAG: acylphosphatase [Thiohalomonadaceae bacterium]